MRANYDFHLHSCLSPCGSDDMTPNNIVNMAKLLGLDIIALSDHSTVGNCAATIEAGLRIDLPVVPAMELTTKEEVHVLCLFASLEAAEEFGHYVYKRLIPILNDPTIFGHQFYLDANDDLVAEEPNLLINATTIDLFDVQALCLKHDGFAIPAHLDRPSNSILTSLGFVTKEMGFSTFELTRSCDPASFRPEHRSLEEAYFIQNSDAHHLERMSAEPRYIDLPELSARAVVDYFLARHNAERNPV